METDDVGKLRKEIRSLKKQVERLEASRAADEIVDRLEAAVAGRLRSS